jgi:hypothetical protein
MGHPPSPSGNPQVDDIAVFIITYLFSDVIVEVVEVDVDEVRCGCVSIVGNNVVEWVGGWVGGCWSILLALHELLHVLFITMFVPLHVLQLHV